MEKVFQKIAIVTVSVGLTFGLTTLQAGQVLGFSFTKIADTGTPIPGGSGNFSNFANFGNSPVPAISQGNVVFNALGPNGQNGVYISINGTLDVVVDLNTTAPGIGSNFASLADDPAISGTDVAFTDQLFGLFLDTGNLSLVADMKTTIVPGTATGTFKDFESVAISDGNLVMTANNGNGVYSVINGTLGLVADTNTQVPNSAGNFDRFSLSDIDDETIVFAGERGNESGIYRFINGTLEVVVDESNLIPGDSVGFNFIGSPVISGNDILFRGQGPLGQNGLFLQSETGLEVVVDKNTLIPDTTEHFNFLLDYAISGDDIAFLGADVNNLNRGIFLSENNSLSKVIAIGDPLDGKIINDLKFGRFGLSGGDLAFYAGFEDGSSGIYSATASSPASSIPEPSTLIGTVLILGIGVFSLKRKGLE